MRKGGGGPKGGQFERDVCKALSLALSDQKRKDLFWRSAMSGGRATMMNRNPHGQRNMAQVGDICSIDGAGNWLTDYYLIECKFHKDVQLTHYLLNGAGKIADWVSTMEEQGAASDRRPLLVFKQNRMPILVLTRETGLSKPVLPLPQHRYHCALEPVLVSHRDNREYYLYTFDHIITTLSTLSNDRPARRRPASDQ